MTSRFTIHKTTREFSVRTLGVDCSLPHRVLSFREEKIPKNPSDEKRKTINLGKKKKGEFLQDL
jgi:hypothetical protein